MNEMDNQVNLLKKLLGQEDGPEIPMRPDDQMPEMQAEAEQAYAPVEPSPMEEAQIAKANNIVEADNAPVLDRQVAGEIEEIPAPAPLSEREMMMQQYKDLISQYQGEMNKESKQGTGDKVLDWMTGIGQAAGNIQNPILPKIKAPELWSKSQEKQQKAAKNDKLGKLTGLQALMKNYLDMSKTGDKSALTEYQKERLLLDERKLNMQKDKAEKSGDNMTFSEKEEKKYEVKQRLAEDKANREMKKEIDSSIPALDQQIKNVKAAQKALKDMKGMTGTGPMDQYLSKFTEDGQKAEQALNKISLDTMVKMFSGMSKAIDSDAERAFFQSAQPSMGKYENVNKELLQQMEENLTSLKKKAESAKKDYSAGKSPQPKEAKTSEVKRATKDGRTAIFDSETKQFLRYED